MPYEPKTTAAAEARIAELEAYIAAGVMVQSLAEDVAVAHHTAGRREGIEAAIAKTEAWAARSRAVAARHGKNQPELCQEARTIADELTALAQELRALLEPQP